MPSIPQRRRQATDSDSDSDGESSRNSTLLHSSNGAKRVRLTPQREPVQPQSSDTSSISTGDDSDVSESDDELSTTGAGQPSTDPTPPVPERAADIVDRIRGIPGGAGAGKYRPGAIVRIKLSNFVTYTSAELRPGPRLNLVIGPNGTGKSTLVCAICLGLGEGPQHLGRAKDAAEYIKHGCREATIEIELAAPPGKRNIVIARVIKRDGNKSTFTVNGDQVPGKRVRELARSLSIQIDNLCQFLPQDKVSEFAALTPVELLQSTQRAAAPREVTRWYEDLKRLREQQKKLQVENRQQQEVLQDLERRQENQREEVERMKHRAAVKKRLKYLELMRPLPKFKELKAQCKELKERKKLLHREHQALNEELGPTMKAINAKKEYYATLDKVVKQKRNHLARANEFAKEYKNEMAVVSEKLKDLTANIEAEKKAGTNYVSEIKKLKQAINRIERQMEEGAPEFDVAAYGLKIREQQRRIREFEDKATELQRKKQPTALEFQAKKAEYLKTKRRLEGLEFQDGQQEEKLRQLSDDSFNAWQWLKEEENQVHFEKPVYGPPLVVCSVKDPKYASALEGLMQKNDFCAFTAQTRNDFLKLQELLYQKHGWHDITIKTCSVPLSGFRPPVDDEELQKLRFDGWAKDYISGPEPVLAALCSENRFHATPITLRDISDAEYRHLENSPISMWIANNSHYQVVRRREYGPAATSTRVRHLRPAKLWTDQPVDEQIKQQLETELNEWKAKMDEIQERMDDQKGTLARLAAEHRAASEEKERLEREKAAKQSALTAFKALPARLEQQKEKYQELTERITNVQKEVESLRKKQDYVSLDKAAVVLKYAKFVSRFRKMQDDLLQAEIWAIEACSDWQSLKEHNAEVTEVVEAKKREIDEVSRQISAMATELPKFADEVRKLSRMADRDRDMGDVVTAVAQLNAEQLEAEIDSAKATLDLTYEGHGTRFIEEFEQRQTQIDRLKEKLEKSQSELADYEHAITEVRGKWEPKLESLVQQISNSFSNFFSRIGCAGQVGIDKAEDIPDENGRLGDSNNFDQWAIRIQVKFRENESLAVLDSHRQSGGERAVSTIFYLMALQSLSASPFRVVDEINQGMDPRNERMVHERMVEIACGQADSDDSGGQYFLITPKLLSGLHYQPGMTVLCIYSGEYMPADYRKLDFKQCVLRMKDMQKKKGLIQGETEEVEVDV
ncbi:SMC family, C-terminal domain containing protein [Coccidioides posadasii C735 delta SOWgp]|uniref:Structural maintenance of chromosomes protein 5 n=1 Tax=Coccidioides posadasii (strain C735) TaxID=222929 RepID=C5NZJ6_COCP7|nr:SMC family, C-terminal domain containing protein [Coccidioides posadasii C735 delta SOWgp]EER29889.1 SMC family, C-terminal domain containing protein [Coccidioides posadasii C735 delta SOWgp]|eukprot:XP_003072034.1 SMC family, C-terminal domain containing protein [Coccidioides posadasii C735 delta SOWgp]